MTEKFCVTTDNKYEAKSIFQNERLQQLKPLIHLRFPSNTQNNAKQNKHVPAIDGNIFVPLGKLCNAIIQ